MRNKANRLTALLIVLGAVSFSANATADSLYDASVVFSVKANEQMMRSAGQQLSQIYSVASAGETILKFDSANAGVDYKKALLVLTNTSADQYALVGKNESGARVKFQILDGNGKWLYSGYVRNNTEVKKLFTFQKVTSQEVTFKFFIEGQLVREQLVTL